MPNGDSDRDALQSAVEHKLCKFSKGVRLRTLNQSNGRILYTLFSDFLCSRPRAVRNCCQQRKPQKRTRHLGYLPIPSERVRSLLGT